jgi:hypothetical protein
MEVIIMAVLNSVAYLHKTQAESVIPEPEFRPSNLSYLRHFPDVGCLPEGFVCLAGGYR